MMGRAKVRRPLGRKSERDPQVTKTHSLPDFPFFVEERSAVAYWELLQEETEVTEGRRFLICRRLSQSPATAGQSFVKERWFVTTA